jgi:hypothetical protein
MSSPSAFAERGRREAAASSPSEEYLGMCCPACGSRHGIDIHASLWVRVCRSGTDADASADTIHEFSPNSTAICTECGHAGRVRDFEEWREWND